MELASGDRTLSSALARIPHDPVWRDHKSVHVFQVQAMSARVAGCLCTVCTLKTGNTRAVVERRRDADGGYDQLGDQVYHGASDDVAIKAARWCEKFARAQRRR